MGGEDVAETSQRTYPYRNGFICLMGRHKTCPSYSDEYYSDNCQSAAFQVSFSQVLAT
jgi:hypothetical protein